MSTESFHSTFNARHLQPEEVAETFIHNTDYEELIQNNHTVLLGPRGCGKTTLMKMLTLPALNSWNDQRAKSIRQQISFNAVYISTDIYWNAQKDSYNKQLSKFPLYSEIVSKVAVTTNVFFSLCESFENVIRYQIKPSNQKQEVELAKNLIKEWKLIPTIPNLSMVKEALKRRTDSLNQHIQKTVFNSSMDEDIKITDEYFYLDFHSSTEAAIFTFERIFKSDKNCKWALCFDELELAPMWLQERLFNSLRSRDQKILYKLSSSPILSISSELAATPGNDLKLVKMWPYGNSNKYHDFSETIVRSLLKKKFLKNVDPEIIFGSNPILSKMHLQSDYEKGGQTWNEIIQLAKKDSGLMRLLKKEKIDPNNPSISASNKVKLDTVLRKIKPIVYFKNYYRNYKEDKQGRKIRSRKSSSLFYGKEVLYKICDGNPRWLIGIVESILKKADNSSISKISEASQARVFHETAEQFNNIIKTIPSAIVERKNKIYTLAGILKEIGDSFFKEIVMGEFEMDPHSTFIIDDSITDEFIGIL